MTQNILGKKGYGQVFVLGFFVAAAAFLPYLFYDKGLFLYYGDFNVQQIPFYQLAGEAIRKGEIWWNWKTDLGANFLGSYSFYLLFSPFFWLTIPFPASITPYLMAPLLMLKLACASLTAFIYLRRFVQQEYAVFCALLYAFSGFSVYNIFFNHFHEAIVFFPLLLVGLERIMIENKYGLFASMIAINAIVNYWFFIGEVIFIAAYFLIRLGSPDWCLTRRRFICLVIEALLGMGIAMVTFLPSVLAIMGNPRTTSDNLFLGQYLWYYSNPQRYLGILHSVFFVPDMPALNNVFPHHGAQWSSLAAYLPLFGPAGVLAYMHACKKDWLKTMIIVCVIMALVPMLNHLFVLLNCSYYTRWFYMPTLLMSLATAKALQEFEVGTDIHMIWGLQFSGLVIGLILLISGLTPQREDGRWRFGLYQWLDKFLATSAITVIFFVVAIVLIRNFREHSYWKELLFSGILISCFFYTFFAMLIGKATYHNNQWIVKAALPGRDQMALQSNTFARSDLYQCEDNLGMYWNLTNIQCFHSVVPASIMDFYPQVGVKRDVSSKPEAKYHALRDFLSVRWLYMKEDQGEQPPMPGYSLVDSHLGYNIYENENYLTMGYSYDQYIDTEEWEHLSSEYRGRVLLRAVYLEDRALEENQDILKRIDSDWMRQTNLDYTSEDVEHRRSMSCYNFTIDPKGFTAHANFDRERLVFFSVPYDKGWRALVDNQPAPIYKVNIGFMAVRVPAGVREIRFSYTPPGLWMGLSISLGSVLLLVGYVLFCRRLPLDIISPRPLQKGLGNVSLSENEDFCSQD